MTSSNGLHLEVGERAFTDSKEKGGSSNMVSNVAKPTVEYKGLQRTITDVVRIRDSDGEKKDETGVSQLMIGIDDAIKTCRRLRQRLERLHKKRNTGFYQQISESPSSSSP